MLLYKGKPDNHGVNIRIIFVTLSILVISTTLFGQRVENIRLELDGETINVYYDLFADSPNQTFDLQLFSSHDNYTNQVTNILGDIGLEIIPGSGKKIVWEAKEDLEELLNKEIDVLAYPFGLYNDEIKKLSHALGYNAGLTFDQDAWQDPQDLMEIKRISIYPNLNVVKFLEKLKNL